MTDAQLSALLVELTSLSDETEWVEFKHNNANPEEIGQYLSALANSAALHDRETAYLVWGIEDGTHNVVGTTFKPRKAKGKGNEDLEPWLMRGLDPQVNFQIQEWAHRNVPVVLFQIPRATHQPVAFFGERFVRIGSHKKKLKDLPSKEAELWATFSKTPFESGIARANLPGDEVLSLIDFTGCFDALRITLPTDQAGILRRLAEEALIVPRPGARLQHHQPRGHPVCQEPGQVPPDRPQGDPGHQIQGFGPNGDRTGVARPALSARLCLRLQRGGGVHQLSAPAERADRPGVPHRGPRVSGESDPGTRRQCA